MKTKKQIKDRIAALEDKIACAEHDESQDGETSYDIDSAQCEIADLREELKLLRKLEFVDIPKVLAYRYEGWDLSTCSIQFYLIELAKRCWTYEEGFSGKRPLGNSGWKYDVYFALAEGGFIKGKKNEHHDWEDIDVDLADQIILKCFESLQLV